MKTLRETLDQLPPLTVEQALKDLLFATAKVDDAITNAARTNAEAALKANLTHNALITLKDSFIHTEGNAKGNKAKTDIIKLNPDVRDALNKVNRLLIWGTK